MSEVRHLEIDCRGFFSVAEQWKEDHENVRELWKVEDLLEFAMTCFGKIETIVSRDPVKLKDGTFGYFLNVLRIWVVAANSVVDVAKPFEASGYEVKRLSELETSIEYVNYFVNQNCNPNLQNDLDRMSSICDERLMTMEETIAIKDALSRTPSTISVQPVPSR